MTTIITIIFFIALFGLVGIFVRQWKQIQNGNIVLRPEILKEVNKEKQITLRDVGILILYIIKHSIQFIIIQISKFYLLSKRKIIYLAHTKTPKVASAIKKLKVPPVPPAAKAFINKSIDETKYKIQKIKKDLEHLEDTIDKKVD